MMNKKEHFIGVFCTLMYILIASIQSVMLNTWLLNVNVFLIVALSFFVVTMVFAIISFFKHKHVYNSLFSKPYLLIALNLLSVFNWLFYFIAVKYLEPSVAVTLTQGIGPVSMTIYLLIKNQPVSLVTRYCHFVIFIGAISLSLYTVIYSVHNVYSRPELVLGIIIAIMCSISITATVLISKQFSIKEIPASVLLSVRFPLLIIICSIVLPFQNNIVINRNTLMIILYVSLIGVSTSLYFLQKGIELATPLTVSTVLALSPMTVFSIQLINNHMQFNSFIFIIIALITIVSMVSIGYDSKKT